MLVLSLFPGIGLLDMAFEAEGFCVVRGPDVLWGGDVRKFHPPAGKFDGVIGGPPCQKFSIARQLLRAQGRDTKAIDLVPEFVRCIEAARPRWYLMENVMTATAPLAERYIVCDYCVKDSDCGGETNRKRRIWFGTKDGRDIDIQHKPRLSLLPAAPAVVAGHCAFMSHERGNVTVQEMCHLQGLPKSFADHLPFTTHGKRKVIGNGVPLSMGRAIARAVKEATLKETL